MRPPSLFVTADPRLIIDPPMGKIWYYESEFIKDFKMCYWAWNIDADCPNILKPHPVQLGILLVSLGFLIFLWILSCIIRQSGITRCYIVITMIPKTLLSIAFITSYLKINMPKIPTFDGQPLEFYVGFSIRPGSTKILSLEYGTWILERVAEISLALETFLLLLFISVSAPSRRRHDSNVTWLCFGTIMLVSLFLGALSRLEPGYNFSRNLMVVVNIFYAACLSVIIMIFIAYHRNQSLKPQKNATLGLTLSFASAVLLVPIARKLLESAADYATIEQIGPIFKLCIILKWTEPIVFSLVAILLLPVYRTVLCCREESAKAEDSVFPHNNKVTAGPLPSKVRLENERDDLSSCLENHYRIASKQHLNHPVISSHPIYLRPQPSVQLVHSPSIFHPSVQQPVEGYYLSAVMQNQHVIPQPTNLVRFSSQPNFVVYSTINPGGSLPNLVAIPSPYIHA